MIDGCCARRVGRRRFLFGATALAAASLASARPGRVPAAGGATPVAGGTAIAPLEGARRDAFDAFVAAALAALGVVGAAVAVVQGGEVVYLRGVGVRGLGERAPLTPDTMMMVDSLTKPMTALMAATLVDDGALAWDARVADLLPGFSLGDPQRAKRLTVADLLSNSAGVPRDDLVILFTSGRLTPDRLIAAAANLIPNAPDGARFQYNNHLYAIGGYAAASATPGGADDLGAAYARAMRERVFDPVGMTDSTLNPAEAMRGGGFATPAAPTLTGELQASPLRDEESFARAVLPAGGVWSNARDMARFVQTLLAGGVAPDGARVVSNAALAETWTPRVAISPDPTLPPDAAAATRGYGLGWFVGEFAGRRVLSHSGGVSGFFSELALLPEAGLGIVVLTNGGVDARTYTLAVPIRLGELLLDRPPRVGPLVAAQAVATTTRFAAARALVGTVDPAAVAPYRGRYASPMLGEAVIELRDGRLRFDAGEVRSEIRPWQDEARGGAGYRFVDPPLAGLPVVPEFRRGDGGRPEVVVRVSGEGAPSFVFAPADDAG